MLEKRIRQELGEEFVAIARCESSFRQFNDDGSVLLSLTSDKGVMQINQVHWREAAQLGYDLDTAEGNIGFAAVLKERNGTGDWYMSDHCHGL